MNGLGSTEGLEGSRSLRTGGWFMQVTREERTASFGGNLVLKTNMRFDE